MKPRCASNAAVTPFSAARATCSGLLIVPKLTRQPAAMLAQIDSAMRSLSPVRPSSFALAAAAPNRPTTPLEWNERSV